MARALPVKFIAHQFWQEKRLDCRLSNRRRRLNWNFDKNKMVTLKSCPVLEKTKQRLKKWQQSLQYQEEKNTIEIRKQGVINYRRIKKLDDK